jgi:hypothetical protein
VKKLFVAVMLTAAMAFGGLTACGSGTPVTYAPVAYGVPGHCYYVNSVAEAIALRAAGLCPVGWVPTLMPAYWHARYSLYYDRPAYYTRFVAAGSRDSYVSKARTFESTHASQIKVEASKSTYKSSNGKTVVGTKLSASKFGGGSKNGGFGSGSKQTRCGASLPNLVPRQRQELQTSSGTLHAELSGYGGGSRSGGSFGGGSRSSGGGSSSYKSGSSSTKTYPGGGSSTSKTYKSGGTSGKSTVRC